MSDVLSMVDVVVELRDSRVPLSTTHPSLPTWVGSRGHVLVLNRIDSVPPAALKTWASHLKTLDGPEPQLVDAKQGSGVQELKRAIMRAGEGVNARRKRRGINPRPVRAACNVPRLQVKPSVITTVVLDVEVAVAADLFHRKRSVRCAVEVLPRAESREVAFSDLLLHSSESLLVLLLRPD